MPRIERKHNTEVWRCNIAVLGILCVYFNVFSYERVVTNDHGSKPDPKCARRRDRQNYVGRSKI